MARIATTDRVVHTHRRTDDHAHRGQQRKVAGGIIIAASIAGTFMVGMQAGRTDALEREHDRNVAILEAVDGDGWGRGRLNEYEFDVLLGIYAKSEQGQPCYMVVADLLATRDYEPYMAPCLGEEDSDAVAVILR